MNFQGISFIIKNTNIRAVVCSSDSLSTFIEIGVPIIICMDSIPENAPKNVQLFTMSQVEQLGKENPSDFVYIKDDDLSAVIYTRLTCFDSSLCLVGVLDFPREQ
jgi:hypothetical protein